MPLSAVAALPSGPARPRPGARRLGAAVLAAGVLATAVAGWHEARVAGSWTSQVTVLFLAPQSERNPNALAVSSDSIVTTAGVVARIVDPHVEPLASTTVTITGRGVRHGYSVELPNTGGQNATNFVTPQLDVQAVGSTAAETTATMTAVVARIRAVLARLQTADGVAARNAITTSLSPPTAPLFYEQGSRVRALAATLLLGTGLSLAVAGAARRVAERRRAPA